MVQTYERPAETMEKQQEPLGSFLYRESHLFYNLHSDLLPHTSGVVAQFSESGKVTTVSLDAQNQPAAYNWQYTLAIPGDGREVTTITTNRDGELDGWFAKFDQMGRMTTAGEVVDIAISAALVCATLKNPKVIESIRTMYAKRAHQERLIASLAVNKTKRLRYSVGDADYTGQESPIKRDDSGKIIVSIELKLADAELDEAIKDLEKKRDRIHFTPLSFIPKPVLVG